MCICVCIFVSLKVPIFVIVFFIGGWAGASRIGDTILDHEAAKYSFRPGYPRSPTLVADMVCPGDKITFTCGTSAESLKGLFLWKLPTINTRCTDGHTDIIVLDQNPIFKCASQTYYCAANNQFTAMNNHSTPIQSLCTVCTLTVVASMDLNGKTITCLNAGGAYMETLLSATLSIAVTPNLTVKVISQYNQLQVNFSSEPPQAHVTYFVELLLGNDTISIISFSNPSTYVFENLTSNTQYRVTVNASNCAGRDNETYDVCTLPSDSPSVNVTVNSSSAMLMWNDLGGCISGYEVDLITNFDHEPSFIVERKSCVPLCVFNLSLSSEYYIATITPLTNEVSGPSMRVLVKGSK